MDEPPFMAGFILKPLRIKTLPIEINFSNSTIPV
jgi:hypothetical protein